MNIDRNLRLIHSDTILIFGQEIVIRKDNDTVCFDVGNRKLIKFHPNTHKIKQVIICPCGRLVFTEDIKGWFKEQQIDIIIMGRNGGEINATTQPIWRR